ncbi:DNA internalization-related competence protein ComEC/Rec2 [Robertmurraya sp. DFI.2.37]|uniref:DNA internalization-related competence protein ComEC/Rec2 n=1 Tax=Robertmurraya sp. DFI.2.37 TaxID=3031819 RepID=UPI00124917F8|nr:DNA internalization-related competence protein ComEC/Rec2 [Robertmurraya sp. DFI.2.37]MDF1508289.1 DNA internalization-related competence protein ComEC/Rec2 [Robertmurraya sp. DFI.2.37]
MKGKYIFVALAALFGILFALEGFVFLGAFFLFGLSLFILKRSSLPQLLLLLSVFSLFFLQAKIYDDSNQSRINGEEKQFLISLQTPIKIDGDFFTAYGKDKASEEKLVLQYRLSSIAEKANFSKLTVGSVCQVEGQLKEPEPPGNPQMFNYQEHLRHRQIFWILEVEKLTPASCQEQNNPLLLLQKVRQTGIQFIAEQLPENSAPLVMALVFGERNFIHDELIEAYQRLGIIHLLAISGLHVGMLMGFLFYCGLRCNISREKMALVLMLVLPVYIVLTGGAPSVIRACFMMLLALLLLKLTRKKLIPADVISIVFLVYCFITPFAIYNVGFQLSFAVSATLVFSRLILLRYINRPFILLFVTSFIAQVASIPIMLYHFYEFSLISFIANIIYVPLYSVVILPLALVWYMLALLFGDILSPLADFLDFQLQLLHEFTLFLAKFPYNTFVLGRPSGIALVILCLATVYGYYLWENFKLNKQLYMRLFFLFLLLCSPFFMEKHFSSGEITLIDVGQGDSILIQLPQNKGNYLIDTGGTMPFPIEDWKKRRNPFEVGKDVLVPFLKSKGITVLDKLILTHGDMDHIGGATAVLNSVKVKELVIPMVANRSELEEKLITLARKKEIPIYFAQKGDRWKGGDYIFHVLSPASNTGLERNDQSIVVYTKLGGLHWMFTGDLEEEGERQLLLAYPNLQIDVLKVGHHGSKTSTSESWLEQLKPRIALISAGKSNRFGHPHHEVLERLEERNIAIFRTDRDGAIRFYFTEDDGTFLTGKPYAKTKATLNGTYK